MRMYERALDTVLILTCVLVGYVLGRLREIPMERIEEQLRRLISPPKGAVIVEDENAEMKEKARVKSNSLQGALLQCL